MVFKIEQTLTKVSLVVLFSKEKTNPVIIVLIFYQMLRSQSRIGLFRTGKIFFQKRYRRNSFQYRMSVKTIKAGTDRIVECQLFRIFYDKRISCFFRLSVCYSFSPAFIPHALFFRLFREYRYCLFRTALTYGKRNSSRALPFCF